MDEETYTYEQPEFLSDGQTADEIHGRMLESLPDDIDRSEGSIPWDFTRPAALEKAEMVEFTLNETVKLMFPQWAYGEWLDLHGAKVNTTRRAANPASGTLQVTGKPGTVILQGFQFATPSDLTASIVFEAVEECTLSGDPDGDGNVTNKITIQAVDGGKNGNVAAGAIKLMVSPISPISRISNPNGMTGGTAEEGDAEYRARVIAAMRDGTSATGRNGDYI